MGSKITADGDCSHEIERHLLLGRKALTNLDSILKSRDITLKRSPTFLLKCKTVHGTHDGTPKVPQLQASLEGMKFEGKPKTVMLGP